MKTLIFIVLAATLATVLQAQVMVTIGPTQSLSELADNMLKPSSSFQGGSMFQGSSEPSIDIFGSGFLQDSSEKKDGSNTLDLFPTQIDLILTDVMDLNDNTNPMKRMGEDPVLNLMQNIMQAPNFLGPSMMGAAAIESMTFFDENGKPHTKTVQYSTDPTLLTPIPTGMNMDSLSSNTQNMPGMSGTDMSGMANMVNPIQGLMDLSNSMMQQSMAMSNNMMQQMDSFMRNMMPNPFDMMMGPRLRGGNRMSQSLSPLIIEVTSSPLDSVEFFPIDDLAFALPDLTTEPDLNTNFETVETVVDTDATVILNSEVEPKNVFDLLIEPKKEEPAPVKPQDSVPVKPHQSAIPTIATVEKKSEASKGNTNSFIYFSIFAGLVVLGLIVYLKRGTIEMKDLNNINSVRSQLITNSHRRSD